MALSFEYTDSIQLLLEQCQDRVRSHSASELPREAVGILSAGGRLYPLINQRRSGHAFMVSSVFIAEGIQWLEDRNDTSVAFYHSHPTTPATPSADDVAMMRSTPNITHVIAGIDRIAAYLCEDATSPPLLIAEVHNGEHPHTA